MLRNASVDIMRALFTLWQEHQNIHIEIDPCKCFLRTNESKQNILESAK